MKFIKDIFFEFMYNIKLFLNTLFEQKEFFQ